MQKRHVKTPLFLFGEDKSSNRTGNYFDGEDPYRQNHYEFYEVRDGGKLVRFAQIYECSERSYGAPDHINKKKMEIMEQFRRAHPGHMIIVLGVSYNRKPLRERVDEAIVRYERTHRAHKILQPYLP